MASRNIYEGVSAAEPIELINLDSIHATDDTSVSQLDAISVTSYNLLPAIGKTEAIIVPGSPAVWSPLPLPQRLRSDRRQPTIREAFPTCPLEPLFRAMSITAPDIDLNSFDIITDRRNLRLLDDFVCGRRQDEFRIDAEIVGNSLLLTRWIDWEQRAGYSGGYGQGFEKKFTEIPECAKGSLVHKRAVAYTLGGLRMMVRFEVDACLKAPPPEAPGSTKEATTPTGHRILLKGVLSKAEEVVEIKTSSVRAGRRNMGKNLGQMWYSQTPVLCQGFHDGGVFVRTKVTNLEEENQFADWESRNAEKIRKLIQVLRCLKEKMVEVQVERVAVFYRKGEHCLRMYEVDQTYPLRLPQDLRGGWNKVQAGADDPHGLKGVMEQLAI